MNIDFRKILIIILGSLWLWLMISILYGCSANYHFEKFIKKGGKVENKTEYVTTTDTIKINGKDSIITVRVPVSCPEIQIPPTRTEIRYKYRLDKKALRVMKQMYKDSLKQARKINASNNDRINYVTKWKTKEVVKVAKNESKNVWNWFWIGLGIGGISAVVIKLIWKR